MLLAAAALACAPVLPAAFAQSRAEPPLDLLSVQQINLEEFEPAIQDQISRGYREVRNRPKDAAAVGKLGMIFQVYGKYELAETCYLRTRSLDGRSFRWAYYLGNVQGWLGKQDQAIGNIREALAIDGSYAPARVRLAQLLFESGEVDQSADAYREALKQNSRLASAHFGLGKVLAARGDWAGAIGSYRRACEISDGYAAAYYALGMAYRHTGDMAKARQHVERFQRLKQAKQPSFDPLMDEVGSLYSGGLTHFAKGSALAQQGKLQAAVVEFKSALEVNPNLAMAHINLIAMYGQLGQPDKAEEHFRSVVELDPGWVEAYFNWGMFLVQQQRKSEAAAMFQKAIEINPNYPDAHVQLASVLDGAGRSEEAAAHYQQALRIDPGHRQAHFLFGHNLVRRHRLDEGIQHYLETIKVEDSKTPVSMHALAIAYEHAGNLERALYYLREARQRSLLFGMQDLALQLERDLKRLAAKGTGR